MNIRMMIPKKRDSSGTWPLYIVAPLVVRLTCQMCRAPLRMMARDSRRVGSIWVLASMSVSGFVLRIPTGWRDFHVPVRLEIRGVRFHVVERGRADQARAGTSVGRPCRERSSSASTRSLPCQQLVEFRLVRNERLALQAKATGLPSLSSVATRRLSLNRC